MHMLNQRLLNLEKTMNIESTYRSVSGFKRKIKFLTKNAAFMIAVCFTVSSCGTEEETAAAQLRPVRSVVAGQGYTNSLRTFSGVSRSTQESRLSFKVSGNISEIPVTVGDAIKAGTVIARLDSSTYDLQRQQAQASVAQNKAAARNAKAAYDRTRSLYANNNVSLGELESARANSESASAQLRASNKSLQLAELNLEYTRLKVDVDCVVDSISISENENVQVGAEVARVNCSDDLEIEISVPEGVIDSFKRGSTATIEFDAISGVPFNGVVVELGVDSSGVGSTFPVTVLVSDKHPSMRTGLAASVSFAIASTGKVNIILPLSALVRRVDGVYVYVLTADSVASNSGTVSLTRVQLGELQTAGMQIKSGLTVGDRVVVAGVSFLRDGLQVLF